MVVANSSDELIKRSAALLAADDLPGAATLCRELLSREPEVPQAQNLAGLIAVRCNDVAAAVGHFARAAALDPHNVAYWRHLGFAQRKARQPADALVSLGEAIRLQPTDAVSLFELGGLHEELGNLPLAIELYRRVIGLEPGNATVLLVLASLLNRQGDARGALEAAQQALQLAPTLPEALFALGVAYSRLGQAPESIAAYQRLEQIKPDFPGLQINLGFELNRLERGGEALHHYQVAIEQKPDDWVAHSNVGGVLQKHLRLDEAEARFRHALTLKPDYHNAHSNLLFHLNYTENSQQAIYEEALRFNQRQAAHLPAVACSFVNSRDPARRLRIGYVSADFRRHSVAQFISSVLPAHDRSRVEVFCYASVSRPDEVTAQIMAWANHWRLVASLSDEQLAHTILADSIDILVDLGGHTAGNRLLAFARRPAPVQVSWIGYPNTTGLTAIDYRITDAVADPPEEAARWHSERLVRLAGGFLCYQSDYQPPIRTAPTGGGITFGSFNALAKMGPATVAAWSAILKSVPDSRLLLKAEALQENFMRERLAGLFGRHGVPAQQLVLLPLIEDKYAHLELYGQVDLALDPFPYNGTTTTFEALWMGVPVVVLRGGRHAARVGASILQHAGLTAWVADSVEDYVALAVSQSADRLRLAMLRPSIRAAVETSPMTDAVRFTAELERAFREMWVEWCGAIIESS